MPVDTDRSWEARWISLAGAITATTGMIVLAGWYAHKLFLIQLAPSFAPMQRNTALGFVLCGVGFLLSTRLGSWQRGAQLCGFLAGTLGFVVLVEYSFAINFGIDQILGPDFVLVQTSHPGRMSPLTATCFTFTGTAIVLAWNRAPEGIRSIIVSLSGALVCAIGAASIFSYFLGTGAAFGWKQVTFMAAHTATAFILLGLGLLVRAWGDHERALEASGATAPYPPPRWLPWCLELGLVTVLLSLWQGVLASADPRLNLSQMAGLLGAFLVVFLIILGAPIGFRNRVATGVGLALFAVAFVGVLSYRSLVQSDDERRWVVHTHLVLEKLDVFLESADRTEAAQRGYIWTGNGQYLIPYAAGLDRLAQQYDDLRTLTGDNPMQQRPLDHLQSALGEFVKGMNERIAMRREKGADAGIQALRQSQQWLVLDGLRQVVSEMQDQEKHLMQGRTLSAESASNRTKAAIVLGNLLVLVFMVATTLVIHREMKARQQAEQEMKTANQELEAFTYTAAHDLRAPLRHMHGFANFLRQDWYDKLDDDGRRSLDKIIASSKGMGRLLDDLLDFSRLGRVKLGRNPVSLSALVERARAELKTDLDGRALTWEIGELPEVEGDRTLLYQVLVNLLSNAVKYTRKSANAHIAVGSEDSGGKDVTVFVRDNGAGFEMKYVDKLFRVFQRLHRTEEFEGTGIGLAIVRRVIERHGGRVWADGTPGRGATFYFSLPRGEQNHGQTRVHSAGR